MAQYYVISQPFWVGSSAKIELITNDKAEAERNVLELENNNLDGGKYCIALSKMVWRNV